MDENLVANAADHFGQLVKSQLERVERMKRSQEWLNYNAVKPVIIGIIGGDGIGPFIAEESRRVLEFLLAGEENAGKVEFRNIEGLTIENRAEKSKAIPDDVLDEIKKCHVTLKGPTTTPRKGDPWPNIESANVAMRKNLDLFANVRPVRVPKDNIDWTFFRENTEGAYVLGSNGIAVNDDVTFDFKVITKQGAERIIRMAFEYAKNNNIDKLTMVTKANVVKTTDGKFLEIGYKMAEEYPGIQVDDWYIDIMTAKLVDPKRRSQFKVMVMPNLYGDILTDEAAEFQGGVGTAGSANIGKQYAMFEAIHGSAPRMVDEGRAKYADPRSMMRAAVMLLKHIGFPEKARNFEMALDVCGEYEKKLVLTGRDNGATYKEFGDYLMETIEKPNLEETWKNFQD